MDNENVEQKQNTNVNSQENGGFSKITNWVKSHIKLLAIILVIVVVAFAAFIIIRNLIGGPEQAVKNYVSAFNKLDGKKIANAMDIQGSIAYSECYSYLNGFDDEEFKDEYDDVDKDDIKEKREQLIDSIDDIDADEIKERKFSIKVIDIKDVEESDECDKLYTVKAKLRLTYNDEDGDKQDTTNTTTFYVYKNKVIGGDLTSLLSIF